MKNLKAEIIHCFLRFVSGFVPLARSRFATLGGKGKEAAVWEEQGIPHENGWLIERDQSRSRELIHDHRYRSHNQLATFDRILTGMYGEEGAYVDGFHLDIYGTLTQDVVKDFLPVLPLVLRSKGCCLAITVADARRNTSLENWPEFEVRAKSLLGNRWSSLYQKLRQAQGSIPAKIIADAPVFIKPFDPDKGTKREFALLIELTELFRKECPGWVPTKMERYVYVSRYQKRPHRMRTYFFHFDQKSLAVPEKAFAKTWVESSLFFGNGDGIREVVFTTNPIHVQKQQPQIDRGNVMENSKLTDLANLIGGATLEEYNQLVADREKLQNILQAIGSFGGVPSQAVRSAPESESTRPQKVKKKWSELSLREQVLWQLETIEMKTTMPKAKWLNHWKKYLVESFGTSKESFTMRAAVARTSGKYRTQFAEKIQKVFGQEAQPYLDRLAMIL